MLVAVVRLRGRKRKGSVFRFAFKSGQTADPPSSEKQIGNHDRRPRYRRYALPAAATSVRYVPSLKETAPLWVRSDNQVMRA